MLKVENISFEQGTKSILQGVSLKVERGQIVSLLGPSGCGKTTLLRIIMGLNCPHAGTVSLDETLLTNQGAIKQPPEKRPLAFLFQDFTLLPHMNVQQNVLMGIRHLARDVQQQRLTKLADLLKISSLLKSPIHSLSGGEQQRVALARTLAIEPDILLLDEPFSNLDRATKTQLYHEVKAIIRQQGMSAILATHDQEEAFYFSDQMSVMCKGQVVATGTPRQLYEAPVNQWLANFTGMTNLIRGDRMQTLFGPSCVDCPASETWLVRPEHIRLNGRGDCTITEIEFYGFYSQIKLRHDCGQVLVCLLLGKVGVKTGERVALTLACSPLLLAS